MASPHYQIASLVQLATALFSAAGMDADKAQCVAELLVTADILVQRTYGIALCPQYIDQIEKGLMNPRGEPEVLRDSGAVLVWDGNYLPGRGWSAMRWPQRASASPRMGW